MQYCKKCGKPIADGEELCEECLNRELIFGDDRVNAGTEDAGKINESNDSEKLGGGCNDEKTNGLHDDFVYVNNEIGNGNNGGEAGSGNLRMTGFAFALVSAILGFVSVCCSYLAAYWLVVMPETSFFVLNIIAAMIVSLIFGIKSIKTAANQKRKRGVMPIPTLVLGISGVVLSGIAIFVFLIGLMGYLIIFSVNY